MKRKYSQSYSNRDTVWFILYLINSHSIKGFYFKRGVYFYKLFITQNVYVEIQPQSAGQRLAASTPRRPQRTAGDSTGFRTICSKNRVPFQLGSKLSVQRTVFHFNRVPTASSKNRVPDSTRFQTQVRRTVFQIQPGSERMFEEPCSPCSVFHVAADDVLIRLDPVAVYGLAVSSQIWNLEPGNCPEPMD